MITVLKFGITALLRHCITHALLVAFLLTSGLLQAQNNLAQTFDSINNLAGITDQEEGVVAYYESKPNLATAEEKLQAIRADRAEFAAHSRNYYLLLLGELKFCFDNEMFEEGFKLFKTLEFDEKLEKFPEVQHNTFHFGALIYRYSGNSYLELAVRRRNIDIAARTNQCLPCAEYMLGIAFSRADMLDSCEVYLDKAEARAKADGKLQLLGGIMNTRGNIYLKRENYEQAIACYNSSLADTALATSDNEEVAKRLTNLCAVYANTNRFMEAVKYGELALKYAVLAESRTLISGLSEALVQFYYETGQEDKVDSIAEIQSKFGNTESIYRVRFIIDSLNDVYRKQSMRELTAEMNESVEKIKLDKEEVVASKSMLTILLIITFVVLATITVFFIRVYRKNVELVKSKMQAVSQTQDYKPANVNQDNAKPDPELITRLEKVLIENRRFMDDSLTLQELAAKLNTNTSDLSKAINTHYEVNFRTLINKLRIEKSVKLLSDSSFNHYSIEGIAKEVGYKNLSTFNKNFKTLIGVTPSFFKKQSQQL